MNIIDIIASMDNFSRIPLKSVNFHYKSAHQVRPVHHSVLHLFPLRRLPRFQLLSWLPAACLEASMAKIWNFIPTVDIQISRHWLACSKELSLVLPKKPYNDQHNEPIFYLPMIRCLDDHQLQLLNDASYFGDWSHGWSRLQQTKRCAFLGEGETRSMLNVIGLES